MGQPDENPNGYGKGLVKLSVAQDPWHFFISERTDFVRELRKRSMTVIENHNFAGHNIILVSPRRKQSNHQLPEDEEEDKQKKQSRKKEL